ncbi:hypothetical protein TrCOL_g4669 [Triparma columacea]|uniref:Uncharacterized protein n=1 Tax=Triparma columacea TaxID=722753 RepID=A0A9W7GNW7_9STRA|nr:hypothetical protein TrCOL_g4669 [Triparma columacea]
MDAFFDDDIDFKGMQKGLSPRNSMHMKRKLTHAITGLSMASLYQLMPKKIFCSIFGGCSIGLLAVEVLRYRKGFKWINRVYFKVFGGVLRKHEMDGKFTGTFYYFAGVTATALLFPPPAAVLGIAQLAIADPTASFFGRKTKDVYWSRIEGGFGGIGRNKGVLGFLGGAASCWPLNFALLNKATFVTQVPTVGTMAWVSAAIGMAGALADLAVPTPTLSIPKGTKWCGIKIPQFHVDDNFFVPVFSGYAAMKILEGAGIEGLKLSRYMIF